MTVFEIVDGEISGTNNDSHDEELKTEVADFEAFAKDISRSLGLINLDRLVVLFEDRSLGLRYGSDEETFSVRGIEDEGANSASSIVAKLY